MSACVAFHRQGATRRNYLVLQGTTGIVRTPEVCPRIPPVRQWSGYPWYPSTCLHLQLRFWAPISPPPSPRILRSVVSTFIHSYFIYACTCNCVYGEGAVRASLSSDHGSPFLDEYGIASALTLSSTEVFPRQSKGQGKYVKCSGHGVRWRSLRRRLLRADCLQKIVQLTTVGSNRYCQPCKDLNIFVPVENQVFSTVTINYCVYCIMQKIPCRTTYTF